MDVLPAGLTALDAQLAPVEAVPEELGWQIGFYDGLPRTYPANSLSERDGVDAYSTPDVLHDNLSLIENRLIAFGGNDGSLVRAPSGPNIDFDRDGSIDDRLSLPVADQNSVSVNIHNVNISGCFVGETVIADLKSRETPRDAEVR